MNARSTLGVLLSGILAVAIPTASDAGPKLAILKVQGMVCSS
jgi:hypothetical protein